MMISRAWPRQRDERDDFMQLRTVLLIFTLSPIGLALVNEGQCVHQISKSSCRQLQCCVQEAFSRFTAIGPGLDPQTTVGHVESHAGNGKNETKSISCMTKPEIQRIRRQDSNNF